MNIIVKDKVIRLPKRTMTEDEFFDFCMANRNLNVERDRDGNILVMEPSGYYGNMYELTALQELMIWNLEHKKGIAFSSSVGLTLPNGAVRSPDVAWIKNERADALTESDKERFAHICPDFVIEVKSKSDSIKALQEKMVEYMENGCKLGFLIDPYDKKAWVYKPDTVPVLVTDFTQKLDGGDLLPGYHLSLSLFSNKP